MPGGDFFALFCNLSLTSGEPADIITSVARRCEYGGLAQLGEHLLCKQGVKGSIPLISTKSALCFVGNMVLFVLLGVR